MVVDQEAGFLNQEDYLWPLHVPVVQKGDGITFEYY
jgi:hypothetical protein